MTRLQLSINGTTRRPESFAVSPVIDARLAPIANRWNTAMGIDVRFPDRHAAFIERCNAAGQVRPAGSQHP